MKETIVIDAGKRKNGTIGGWCQNTVLEVIQCNVANSVCSKETRTCVCMDGYELDAKDEHCVPIEVLLQVVFAKKYRNFQGYQHKVSSHSEDNNVDDASDHLTKPAISTKRRHPLKLPDKTTLPIVPAAFIEVVIGER